MKKKVMTVFGTRPEAIKICPLVNEMKKREGLDVIVCVTAQHRQMLDQVLKTFGVVPDYDLDIMKDRQTLFDITTNILNGIKSVLEEVRPDVVLVHGDTSTTFVTALACFYLQIPVGHVEAGLRTYNIYSPYPEEFNRQAVGIISQYNFAPTQLAADHLIQEGKEKTTIYITGNTVIDAMQHTVKEDYSHPELDWIGKDKLIFITAHRRENLGEPMHHMFRAIRRVLDEHPDCKAVYPIHMNPVVREAARQELGDCDRIHIIEPIEVFDCHNFEARSFLCLTDSGGIQEECPSYGVPVLVMRDTTERPEGVEAGTLKLVGTDEEVIYRAFTELLEDEEAYKKMSCACNPYGDGHACERIADILETGTYEPWVAGASAATTREIVKKMCEKDKCRTGIKYLLKFGKRERLESLVRGNLYFSNAITFWNIEDKLGIKGQGDALEAGMKVFAQKMVVSHPETNEVLTEIENAKVFVRIEPAKKIPVFCMFAAYEDDCRVDAEGKLVVSLSEEKKQMIREHFPEADAVVIIPNPKEFINDIRKSIGTDIKAENVHYFQINKGICNKNGQKVLDMEFFKYLMQDASPTKVDGGVQCAFLVEYAFRALFCKDVFFDKEQEYRIVLPKESIEAGKCYSVNLSAEYQVCDLKDFFER